MTNAQLAAKLLREAASFYRILSDGKDAQTSERIEKFGRLYEQVADKVEVDPQSEVEADTLT
jgi:copper homeostasis protein CutC